jgi:iron complex transport system ATP-binding protein
MVAGRITAVGAAAEVLTAERISAAYSWPVRVVQHPLTGGPLVLPDGGNEKAAGEGG